MVDLPCIIESVKTVDRKTFLKTGDISQMLLVDEKETFEDLKVKQKDTDGDQKASRNDKRFQFPHGGKFNAHFEDLMC